MSFERENRAAIVSYFQKGAKGETLSKKLGVEVEHFVVYKDSRKAVPYDAGEGAFGVRQVLDYLSRYYPEEMCGLEGDLIGLANDEASLTLEPAAQLEISTAPYASIDEIVRVYRTFRERLDSFLDQHGCMLVTRGYHPTEKALDLPLIPKKRYHFMNDYFHALGTHGERMMRASASTQVSIDYTDEADAIRKMRIAQALAPMLASLTDNVERFEGEVPAKPLSRFFMWRDVDPDRCGSVPGLFDEDFSFGRYADWLLDTCPIFITRSAADDPKGPALRSMTGKTAAQAYGNAPMSEDDVEHLLSMFWPDVRLKQFVEIRPADALPLCAMAGYAALLKGLFYNPDVLDQLENAFEVVDGIWLLNDSSTEQAARAIQEKGLEANLYGKSLAEWNQFLRETACSSLSEEEQAYVDDLFRWRCF